MLYMTSLMLDPWTTQDPIYCLVKIVGLNPRPDHQSVNITLLKDADLAVWSCNGCVWLRLLGVNHFLEPDWSNL